MADDALLSYATPRTHAQTPRADWLAVFSFAWTFATCPSAAFALVAAGEQMTGPLRFALLVLMPAVGVVCGYIATERGAPWDSPYRATGLAVCSVPVACLMVAAGGIVCLDVW